MAMYGKARNKRLEALKRLRPFKQNGCAMSARSGPVFSCGLLPQEYYEQYVKDKPVYTVLSYSTPIGWINYAGAYVVPPVKYSMSTNNHQSLLREAWGMQR